MEGSARPQARPRRRRADAEQNITAILQAATKVLTSQPEASVEDVARAAGVTRQTVYAHFASREALLNAVIEQAMAEASAAFEAAGLENAAPAEALIRLLDVGWQVSARYPFLWNLPEVSPVSAPGRRSGLPTSAPTTTRRAPLPRGRRSGSRPPQA